MPQAPQHTQDQTGRHGGSLLEQSGQGVTAPAQLLADYKHEEHKLEDCQRPDLDEIGGAQQIAQTSRRDRQNCRQSQRDHVPKHPDTPALT